MKSGIVKHGAAIGIMALLLLGLVPLWQVDSALAQENAVTLTYEEGEVKLLVPEGWLVLELDEATLQAFSGETRLPDAERLTLNVSDLQAPYGYLPEDDRIGTFMELRAAILSISGDIKPEVTSEVIRFTWHGFPAALFLTYRGGSPQYYARWFGVALNDESQVLLLEQAVIFPAGDVPDADALQNWDAILGSLQINGEQWSADPALEALTRASDPLAIAGGNVASLRLTGGLEVRIAAPPEWHRRDVSQSADYPTNYFFEQDLRDLHEGDPLTESVIQVSLLDEARLLRLLDTDTLPPPGELAIAYLNALLLDADAESIPGTPVGFAWTENHYAVLLPIAHGDMLQHVLVVEADGGLVMITLYAPDSRWEDVLPIWQNVLASLTINGDGLPAEPIADALSTAVFSSEEE